MPHSQVGSGAWYVVGQHGQPLEPLRRRRWGTACERGGRKTCPIAAVAAGVSGPRWFPWELVADDGAIDDVDDGSCDYSVEIVVFAIITVIASITSITMIVTN